MNDERCSACGATVPVKGSAVSSPLPNFIEHPSGLKVIAPDYICPAKEFVALFGFWHQGRHDHAWFCGACLVEAFELALSKPHHFKEQS